MHEWTKKKMWKAAFEKGDGVLKKIPWLNCNLFFFLNKIYRNIPQSELGVDGSGGVLFPR